MRSLIVMGTFLTLSLSLVMADTFTASVVSIDVKGNVFKGIKGKKKGEEGTPFTLPISDKVKVLQGKFNPDTKKVEAGDPLEGGLKNEKLNKENAKVTITTDADNKKITEIILGGGGKGGKKKE